MSRDAYTRYVGFIGGDPPRHLDNRIAQFRQTERHPQRGDALAVPTKAGASGDVLGVVTPGDYSLEVQPSKKSCSRDFLAEDLPRRGRRGQHPLPALAQFAEPTATSSAVNGAAARDRRLISELPVVSPMTVSTTSDTTWVTTALQKAVREVVGSGWSVTKSGSKLRLRVRDAALTGSGYWGRTLPLRCEIGSVEPLQTLVKDLSRRVTEGGLSLEAAWQQMENETSPGEEFTPGVVVAPQWGSLAKEFLNWRETHGTQVGGKTLELEKRYLDAALSALSSRRPPTRAYDLLSQATMPWRGKPRAKKQAVETVMRFLSFCHDHRGLPDVWLLPKHQKRDFLETSKKSTKATLTGQEILDLIDSCPSAEWQHVLCFLAAYGLRPEELFHLELRVNPDTGKKQFWCSYEKASGLHKTKQRWLWPIPLEDSDGNQVHWDLAGLWEKGLCPFPSMKERGEALSQYLRRLPLWKQWRAEKEENGEVLRPYAFRDSYSLRGHLLGVPSGQVADAMGHSLSTHCSHYTWATQSTTAAVFEALMGGQQ